ncbi:helix-turn-helix domain-containing protein [Halobacillus amylolyticus]|uniref:Helix-turn-helix domain-containing protein n=1 Tax=Halobacillus amylolyticus TaxID=2932259 RepID=A0ABY4H792_9BACI|nr:helix-turn-helix domain-containing protein [Halobacillus amylolyticus]UOR10734.1 helix-turn-helix domain-containing protein [Halobacillus amylolyticus]
MGSLGGRLRKARENKGWSQTLVCEKLGISNSRLSGYERNYREPDTKMLSTLATLYAVSIDWLMGMTEESARGESENEFESFISDPDLQRWYADLPKSSEEDLKKLRKMWEIIKSE